MITEVIEEIVNDIKEKSKDNKYDYEYYKKSLVNNSDQDDTTSSSVNNCNEKNT